MLQLSPVAAELELTAEERLPRRDVSTLTIISPKASASSRGPRDEAAMSPQAVLPLRDFSAPEPAGLTNCDPAPLSVLELPEYEGGLDLGALGSRAVEGPEGLTDCVFFPPAEAEADLDGEGLVCCVRGTPWFYFLCSRQSSFSEKPCSGDLLMSSKYCWNVARVTLHARKYLLPVQRNGGHSSLFTGASGFGSDRDWLRVVCVASSCFCVLALPIQAALPAFSHLFGPFGGWSDPAILAML